MSLELIDAVATAGTFLVIAASAIAAVIQLRHMRGSNQIIALNEFRETMESHEIRLAQQFVSYELPKRMADPVERAKMTELPFAGDYERIGTIANLFENVGEFVRIGIIDDKIACELWCFVVLRNWSALAPLVFYLRQRVGYASLWENFEYLAVLSKRYIKAHPHGAYPKGVERMPSDRSLID
jgi:hypothetical protein